MTVLVIYNSSDADSIAAAAIAVTEYPAASVEDTDGLSEANIDTMIATYGASTQNRIMVCVDTAFAAETVAQGNIDITTVGGDNDLAEVTINDGTDTFVIGSYDVQAADVEADVVDGLVASINAQTSYHGYSADDNGDDFDVNAPAGLGAAANAYTLGFATSTGGTSVGAVTDMGTTTAGVTQVGVEGDLTTAQITALDAKLDGADPASDGATQEFDRLALSKRMALSVWEFLYPTITRPLAVHYMGDHQEDSDEYGGTATSGAATTITDTGQAWSVDQFEGFTVSITGGTGSGQSNVITSNTATALTTAAWGVAPDNTSVYAITPAPAANTNYEDFGAYIRTYMSDVTDGATKALWKDLLDENDNIDNLSANHSTKQDIVALADYVARGNNMNDFAAL